MKSSCVANMIVMSEWFFDTNFKQVKKACLYFDQNVLVFFRVKIEVSVNPLFL